MNARAQQSREPGWIARGDFYTRGKVPAGYENWARVRLWLPRWIGVYLLIEASVWMIVFVAVVALTDGTTVPTGLWVPAVLFAAIAPFSARHYLKKAERALDAPRRS